MEKLKENEVKINEVCKHCRGNGYNEVVKKKIVCPDCEGRGTVEEEGDEDEDKEKNKNLVVCQKCKKEGYILTD